MSKYFLIATSILSEIFIAQNAIGYNRLSIHWVTNGEVWVQIHVAILTFIPVQLTDEVS